MLLERIADDKSWQEESYSSSELGCLTKLTDITGGGVKDTGDHVGYNLMPKYPILLRPQRRLMTHSEPR